MSFPREIIFKSVQFNKLDVSPLDSGLNDKAVYANEFNEVFILKIEKERKLEDIFSDSLSSVSENFQKHVDALRIESAITSVIVSNIARAIFPSLYVPEQCFCYVNKTPAVFSKMIAKEAEFKEFLKESKVIKDKDPKSPSDWKEGPFEREKLGFFYHSQNLEYAVILGRIYYVALLMGHWDIVNNINLSNSGVVKENGKLKPCIVDWGNCIWGFGGINQDATAFKNPEFVALQLSKKDLLTGFEGCVPFDGIVYPKLPRQLVSNLFDLTSGDAIGNALLKGFQMMHAEAKKNFSPVRVVKAIEQSFDRENECYKKYLNEEFFTQKKNLPGIVTILSDRLTSLQGIICDIAHGKTMAEISEVQFKKIVASQHFSSEYKMGL